MRSRERVESPKVMFGMNEEDWSVFTTLRSGFDSLMILSNKEKEEESSFFSSA